MTEDEAKTKWCPFSRALLGHKSEYMHLDSAVAFNRLHVAGDERPVAAPVACLCIASACMAWRSTKDEKQDSDYHIRDEQLRRAGYREAGVTGNTRHFVREARGYCGLAGKP